MIAALLAVVLVSAGGSSAALHFGLVFRIAPPRASGARALALARSFGLGDPTVRKSPSSYVLSDGARRRTLVLYRASGGFDYVDRALYRRPPTGELPSAAHARRLAIDLLRTHNLLPAANVRIVVRRDSRSDATAEVVTMTPLAAGAPVLDGAITLWFGGGGSVERLRDEQRPLGTAAIRLVPRPRSEVLKEIHDDLGPTGPIRLRLAYVAEPSYLPQSYLEPVYEAILGGFVVDRVRATTFTPRAIILSPDPDSAIVAGKPVRFRARRTEGRRPYRFRWYGNASGFLGAGNLIEARLLADDTEIRLAVRDASGAGTSYVLPVSVVGTPSVATGSARELYGDGTIGFEAGQDATHPLVFRDVEAAGLRRADAIYFDQFRYVVLVRFQGADYHIVSGRCAPLTAAGGACALPASPYAHSLGASPPAGAKNGTRVDSTLVLDDLPGRLSLVVEGSAENAYCGPTGELGAIALQLLLKFVFGSGTQLGGDCPGFRPSVRWSYSPPESFKPSDLARLCLQAAGLCDVPQALLNEWVTGNLDAGPQPQIADFRLSVYTAIEPSGAEPERAALARDGDRPVALAASDGPVDSSCRPSPCISPIATERSALLATPGARGEWDDLSLKSESPAPHAIAFPGCNSPPNGYDLPACIHLREHWAGAAEARSRGQEVTVFIVRRHGGEASPSSVEALADGEPLRQDAEHGYELVLWHRSTASSTECYPSGGVDNTDRPCRVFPTPLFFTPR